MRRTSGFVRTTAWGRSQPTSFGDGMGRASAVAGRACPSASPSRGEGLRIFAHGTLPPGGRRRRTVELYDRDRYLTVTGAHLDGTPRTIEERAAELARVHARVFSQPASPPTGRSSAAPVDALPARP